MKSAYFTIHLGKNPPPQNGSWLKFVFFYNFFYFYFKIKHQFHILHFLNSTGLFTNPTGRHYTKYRFSPDTGVLYKSQIPLNWSIIFLKSWTSTNYFSNSTGSSVTNRRFSPIIHSCSVYIWRYLGITGPRVGSLHSLAWLGLAWLPPLWSGIKESIEAGTMNGEIRPPVIGEIFGHNRLRFSECLQV